eukprot:g2152.t1
MKDGDGGLCGDEQPVIEAPRPEPLVLVTDEGDSEEAPKFPTPALMSTQDKANIAGGEQPAGQPHRRGSRRHNSVEKGKDEGSAEVSEWTPLGLEGVTYVEDDGYADDESGYSGDDDGDGFGDHNHSGSSLWAEDGSDIVWYEVIDAESGFPYWLHARTGVSQWEPPLWLDQIDPASEHLDVVPINFDAQLMESGQCNPMEASFVVKHFSEKAHLGIVYADKHRCYKLKEEDECYCECFVKSHSHSGL